MKDFQATLEALGIRFQPSKPKTKDAKQRLLRIDHKSMAKKHKCTGDVMTCDSKKHIQLTRERLILHCCQCSRNNKNTK